MNDIDIQKKLEQIHGVNNKDKFVVTISKWKENGTIETNCYIHDFPTRDLPIARNDISALIHETYINNMEPNTEEIQDNKIKNLLEQ